MRMKQRKPFKTPLVLQTVPVNLEEDLLLGPSADLKVLAAGQDYFEWNMDVEGAYTVDDWTVLGD